jgi:hypothetical protein
VEDRCRVSIARKMIEWLAKKAIRKYVGMKSFREIALIAGTVACVAGSACSSSSSDAPTQGGSAGLSGSSDRGGSIGEAGAPSSAGSSSDALAGGGQGGAPELEHCGAHDAPCLNSGSCTESTQGYVCACPPRYVGRNCQNLRFQGIGMLSGDASSSARGLSRDGSTVVGDSTADNTVATAVRFSVGAGTLQAVESVTGSTCTAHLANGDGTFIVGSCELNVSPYTSSNFRWDASGSQFFTGAVATAWISGISADAATLVGLICEPAASGAAGEGGKGGTGSPYICSVRFTSRGSFFRVHLSLSRTVSASVVLAQMVPSFRCRVPPPESLAGASKTDCKRCPIRRMVGAAECCTSAL